MVSLIKGGLNYSDFLNTVSPTYAREIQTPEFGFGLDGVLRARSSVLTGILNGVDYEEWSPESDRHIAARYSAHDLSGKRACKQDLIREFGLSPAMMERPLLGVVSRLDARQKGLHLVADIVDRLAAEDIGLALLGTGDPSLEDRFRRAASIYPGRIGVKIGFDNSLAHKIEAGADMFVMPSRYEPCGLNQIYSLRYGAVPVVHATGGLDDTIDEGTGFKFYAYHSEELWAAIRRACDAFADPPRWAEIMRAGMAKDFSWAASAATYMGLYRRM
jgi:starch synthase